MKQLFKNYFLRGLKNFFLYIIGNNTVANKSNKKSEESMQRTLSKSENTEVDKNGSELLFNIGPLFLHVTSYNRIAGRSFHYFYECSGNNIFTQDNFDCNVSKSSKVDSISFLNNKNHTVRVNIYKEKYICEKYLSRTFLFFGSEASALRSELLKMINVCEDLKTWNDKWVKKVIEQMYIFFCCIRHGKVHVRLLESAGLCAKMLLIKDFRNELMEFKYSYIAFHQNFIDKIDLLTEHVNLKSVLKIKKLNKFISEEQIDVIEGFTILSFETEEEMNRYTQFDELFNKNVRACSLKVINTKRNVRKNINPMEILPLTKKQKLANTISPNELVKITEISLNKCPDIPEVYFDEKKQEISASKFMELNNPESLHSETNNLTQRNKIFNSNEDYKDSQVCEIDINLNKRQNLVKQNEYIDFKTNFIPIIHGCDKSSVSICKCKQFSLFMLLSIGKDRPLSKKAIENLDALETNSSQISFRMASIAACALVDPKRRTLKRVLIPVKNSLVMFETKCLQTHTNQLIFKELHKSEIDSEVETVMNWMVDYIETHIDNEVNQSEKQFVKCVKRNDRKKKTKVQRELNKLSASFTESLDVCTECGKDFYNKKCDCQSQTGRNKLSCRCKKEFCECSKREGRQTIGPFLEDEEAMSKFQDGIKILDGKKFGLTNLVDRSKRAIKLSTRFRNTVLWDEASLIASSTPRRRLEVDIEETTGSNKLKVEKVKKSDILMRRLKFCANLIKSKKTIGDLFVWCDKHHKYNCTCLDWVCIMKRNALIFRPENHQRYLAHKHLMRLDILEETNYEVFFYDAQSYSARTYGAPINYASRNKTATFKAKRMFELKQGILSSTNSYIKKNFSIYKVLDDEMKTQFGNELFQSSTIENLRLKPEAPCSSDLIEVCQPAEDTVIVLSDSDEDNECNSNSIIEHIKSVYDSSLEDARTNAEKQKGNDNTKIVAMPKNASNKNEKLTKKAVSNHAFAEVQFEPQHSKEFKQSSDMSSPRAELNYNYNKISNHIFNQSYKDLDNNFDSHLENELIQLEDHPLKDEIYGPDNLPKLSLYCLTPGIGYLPIVEHGPQVLVVQDPVSPMLLHSFKNLNCANIWLNKFLKDFLVFESIDICLKWVIVKPGIIKLKKSLPFTPAILENSSIIITKDGELVFNKDLISLVNSNKNKFASTSRPLPEKEIRISGQIQERKRKLSHILPFKSEDHAEKRKKVEIQPLPPLVVKRPVNMIRYYPGKKSAIQSTSSNEVQQAEPSKAIGIPNVKKAKLSCISKAKNVFLKNYISTLKATSQANSKYIKVKVDSLSNYKIIPRNLFIPKNTASNILLTQDGQNNAVPKVCIVTDPVTGISKMISCSPYIITNIISPPK